MIPGATAQFHRSHSLVRSCLFRMIALLTIFLPLSILVAHVWAFYPRQSSGVFTLGLSLASPARSSEFAPVRRIPVSGTSVVGDPSLSADFVNQILVSAGSPAAGTGQGLYNLSVQSGIDDAYALAVFGKESAFGKYGAAFEDHALGNIVCAGYLTCNGRFRWYPNWEAGYEDFYQLISRDYVARGFSTVETITLVYAPSSENDTGLSIQQICQSMLAFRSAQSLTIQEVSR
jgi:hypothetical protein